VSGNHKIGHGSKDSGFPPETVVWVWLSFAEAETAETTGAVSIAIQSVGGLSGLELHRRIRELAAVEAPKNERGTISIYLIVLVVLDNNTIQ
jgi:hypothetical protein